MNLRESYDFIYNFIVISIFLYMCNFGSTSMEKIEKYLKSKYKTCLSEWARSERKNVNKK